MIRISCGFQKSIIRRSFCSQSSNYLCTYHVREGPYNFIDGQKNYPIDSNSFTNVLNPTTSLTLAEVPASGPNEIDKAVLSSRTAYDSWSQVPL